MGIHANTFIFKHLLIFYFLQAAQSSFPAETTYPVVTDDSDCPAPYRNITNWGECIYAAEMVRFENYSPDRQQLAQGTGPHGCYFDQGNWNGIPNWLLFNPELSDEPATEQGRNIICQSEYARGDTDGTCPEGFVHISNSNTCSTAATYLSLTETNPVETDVADQSTRPVGCYYNTQSNGLFLNSQDQTNFVADSENFIICRKKYAVRLFAVNLFFATSISFNGVSHYLPSGTSWKTLGWLEIGESFTVNYNPVGQPQTCHFHYYSQITDDLTLEIPTGIPSVVTVNLYCDTLDPTLSPSASPSVEPSAMPTLHPLTPSFSPTVQPTICPSLSPTYQPTFAPTSSPTEGPCDTRTADNCTPNSSRYCYFNNATSACIELSVCPTEYCTSYCGVEVGRCGVASFSDASLCSCELCEGSTDCEQQKTELLHLDGDYDAIFPIDSREETEQQFLDECTSVVQPVQCTNVFEGSIYLEIRGDESLVDAAVGDITRNGLTLPSFRTISILTSVRTADTDPDDDDFATIWIVVIIIACCVCILVGCFFNHRRKTYSNYDGGATPRPQSNAVVELDGKKLDYSDTSV